jgi:AbrB family looped-hinge helix DNA binding protein
MEELMEMVRLSSKYQVVIPRSVRQRLELRPGQRVHVLPYDNRIELILVRPIAKMRGFLKGIDTSVARGADRL